MNIHVVSINIKASNNPFAALSFMRDYKTQATSSPVIFCLQELDINAKRSGSIDVPKTIANGNDYIFAPTISFSAKDAGPTRLCAGAIDQWDYGIASFVYGAKIKSHKIVSLGPDENVFWEKSNPPTNLCWECEPRGALLLEVDTGKEPFWVVNTHLAHKSDRAVHSDYRLAQIEALDNAIQKTIPSGAAVAIVGDYNAIPNNPDLAVFHALYTMAPISEPTKVTKAGPVQVDHCFFRNAALAGRPEVMPTTFSDHKAVACKFTY